MLITRGFTDDVVKDVSGDARAFFLGLMKYCYFKYDLISHKWILLSQLKTKDNFQITKKKKKYKNICNKL